MKKIIPKAKIDITGSFDPCVVAPFVFGLLVVACKMLLVDKTGWAELFSDELLVDSLSVGATAVTIYKLFASTDKESFKNMMKNNAFSLVCSQIFLFSDARERLLDKSLKVVEFVAAIRTLTASLTDIYEKDNESDKTEELNKLFGEKLPALNFSERELAEIDRVFRAFFASGKTVAK